MGDDNGDGLVSLYEFKRSLYLHLGVLPSHMDALFRYIDHNDSGYINYDEWLQFFAQDFNTSRASLSNTAGAPISPLRRRIMQREMQHAAPVAPTVPSIGDSGIKRSSFSDRSSILDMVESKVAEGQINVAPLRQMQLVDEIRALNLPVSTDAKVQVFRELQLSPVYESKFLADIRAMDYLRSSMKENGSDRRGLEGLFVGPTREVALVNEIRRTPLSSAGKLGLLKDLPLSTSKKLDLIHELRLVQYIDDVYKERAR